MKRIFSLIAFLLFVGMIVAQAPQGINYQAVARDIEGKPLPGQTINVGIKISDAFATLYQETHTVQTNNFGLFNLSIGQGSPTSGSFSGINWAGGAKSLEVSINGTPGGPQPILSVPYALYAEKTNIQAGAGIGINGRLFSLITNQSDVF